MEKKDKKTIMSIVFVNLFLVGTLLLSTFNLGNKNKYDSKVNAYRIEVSERTDSDGTMYSPIYYYKVNGIDYSCSSSSSGSSYPNKNKNIVYYDSKNPSKCLTQYDVSSSKFFCYVCIGFLIIVNLAFFFGKKKDTNINNQQEISPEMQEKIEEQAIKAQNVILKVTIVYRRIVLISIIIVLLIFTLIDFSIFKQTLKSKDYIKTTANYSYAIENEDGTFDDFIYVISVDDKEYEITISLLDSEIMDEQIEIKYNPENPKDFYEKGSYYESKADYIWFFIKVFSLIGLVYLFFNKKLLSKINITMGNH